MSKKKSVQDFQFGSRIGEGSYSTVYKAVDVSTRKVFAIKVLSKRHIVKEKKIKYVNIEKITLNRLGRHPGIVTLYYTFQDDTSLYFVIDIADHGELLTFIRKLGSLSETCSRYYMLQLIDAVDFMHKKGVIHRDLKPENILVNSERKLMITDFGAAKVINLDENGENIEDDTTEESFAKGSFVGTAEYVSPELLQYNKCGFESDIWAIGCILFQFIVGVPPFKGKSEYQTFEKIVHLQYQWPNFFIPELIKDLVSKLLKSNPLERLTMVELQKHPWFGRINWNDKSKIWATSPPNLEPYRPLIEQQLNQTTHQFNRVVIQKKLPAATAKKQMLNSTINQIRNDNYSFNTPATTTTTTTTTSTANNNSPRNIYQTNQQFQTTSQPQPPLQFNQPQQSSPKIINSPIRQPTQPSDAISKQFIQSPSRPNQYVPTSQSPSRPVQFANGSSSQAGYDFKQPPPTIKTSTGIPSSSSSPSSPHSPLAQPIKPQFSNTSPKASSPIPRIVPQATPRQLQQPPQVQAQIQQPSPTNSQSVLLQKKPQQVLQSPQIITNVQSNPQPTLQSPQLTKNVPSQPKKLQSQVKVQSQSQAQIQPTQQPQSIAKLTSTNPPVVKTTTSKTPPIKVVSKAEKKLAAPPIISSTVKPQQISKTIPKISVPPLQVPKKPTSITPTSSSPSTSKPSSPIVTSANKTNGSSSKAPRVQVPKLPQPKLSISPQTSKSSSNSSPKAPTPIAKSSPSPKSNNTVSKKVSGTNGVINNIKLPYEVSSQLAKTENVIKLDYINLSELDYSELNTFDPNSKLSKLSQGIGLDDVLINEVIIRNEQTLESNTRRILLMITDNGYIYLFENLQIDDFKFFLKIDLTDKLFAMYDYEFSEFNENGYLILEILKLDKLIFLSPLTKRVKTGLKQHSKINRIGLELGWIDSLLKTKELLKNKSSNSPKRASPSSSSSLRTNGTDKPTPTTSNGTSISTATSTIGTTTISTTTAPSISTTSTVKRQTSKNVKPKTTKEVQQQNRKFAGGAAAAAFRASR